MKQVEDENKVDQAIDQASANTSFEGMNLTTEEKYKIKRDLEQKKSLLISFFELYQERQKRKNGTSKSGKRK